jgi:DNA relaxase NicK
MKNKANILNTFVRRARVQTMQLTDQSEISDFNEEVSHFKLEWSPLLYLYDDMNDEDLNDILMQIDMSMPHENLVLDSEHSIVSLPMS